MRLEAAGFGGFREAQNATVARKKWPKSDNPVFPQLFVNRCAGEAKGSGYCRDIAAMRGELAGKNVTLGEFERIAGRLVRATFRGGDFWRQVSEVDKAVVADRAGQLEYLAKFADVARPGVALQGVPGRLGDSEAADVTGFLGQDALDDPVEIGALPEWR